MKILATIKIGATQTTQGWEMTPGEQDDHLKIADLPDGKSLVIKIQRRLIMNLKGAEIAEKHYPGTLNITDAIVTSY